MTITSTTRAQYRALRVNVSRHVRDHAAYENYPAYAMLVALSVWLFQQYPVRTSLDFQMWNPTVVLFGGFVVACGSVLAFALGLIGMWRPGAKSIVLSCIAMLLACPPKF
jgi:hypothetical protein